MTKLQLKEKYLEWNINNGLKVEKRNDEIFREMQQLAENNGFTAWFGMDSLLKELMITKDCEKALELYAEYHKNKGRRESLFELAILTENFKIN